MITDKTVGIVNKLITQGLFVFPCGLVQMGGLFERVKLHPWLHAAFPLALSSPIKPTTPQQYGAINYRRAAINAARRGERLGHINRTNGHIKDLQLSLLHL